MENQELLHPEDAEMQNQEVNSGASMEAQETMSQETPASEVEPVVTEEPTTNEPETEAPVAAEETVAEPAPETVEATTEEPVQEPVAATEEPASPEEMMAEMDQQQTATEPVTETEAEETAPEETLEQVEAAYAGFDLEQCVTELERLVKEPNFNLIKMRVGVLRARIIEFFRERKRAAQQAFEAAKAAAAAAAAENPEAPAEEVETPSNEPDEIEVRFNKAFQQYKDSKAKFIEALEAQKQDNLNAKNKIIEGLKNLIETESNLKVLNDKFKEFQEQWKAIGPVPQTESNNLWQNYHFYVEKFFDILRLNKEAREMDYKKNLESKLELCEKAESLLLVDSINQSFKDLQTLHEQWKEIGPVPEDKKEEVWERFKAASDQINQRRKEHYDKLFAEEQNNYNAKLVLCEQAEEITSQASDNVNSYN